MTLCMAIKKFKLPDDYSLICRMAQDNFGGSIQVTAIFLKISRPMVCNAFIGPRSGQFPTTLKTFGPS